MHFTYLYSVKNEKTYVKKVFFTFFQERGEREKIKIKKYF